MDGSTEGGSTPDKYRIGGGSRGIIVSVTVRKIFLQGANTAIKMNGAIVGDSATRRKKFMARHWVVLIGSCGVETRKQVKKN